MQNLEKLLLEFILERKKKNEDLTLKMIPFDFRNSWASSPFLSSPLLLLILTEPDYKRNTSVQIQQCQDNSHDSRWCWRQVVIVLIKWPLLLPFRDRIRLTLIMLSLISNFAAKKSQN